MQPPPDDRYRVETPEQIGLEYDVAGLGSRFLASLVDIIFLSLLLVGVACLGGLGVAALGAAISDAFSGSDGDTLATIFIAVIVLLTFAVFWGYYVFFETIWNGQSPGKRWTGLRVIQEGGYPIRFSHAAIRNIVRVADFLPFAYVIGAVVMLVDKRSRRLGDLVAGTIVVKELPEVAAGTIGGAIAHIPTAAMPAMQGVVISGDQRIPNLHRITAADQSLIREYFMRRPEFLPEAAASLSLTLANAFARKLEYTPTGDVPDQFLARIVRQMAERAAAPPGNPGS